MKFREGDAAGDGVGGALFFNDFTIDSSEAGSAKIRLPGESSEEVCIINGEVSVGQHHEESEGCELGWPAAAEMLDSGDAGTIGRSAREGDCTEELASGPVCRGRPS